MPILALLSSTVALPGIIPLIIYVFIFVVVVGLIWYLVQTFCPEPLKKYALALIVVICVIFLIYFLLSIVGGGGLNLR